MIPIPHNLASVQSPLSATARAHVPSPAERPLDLLPIITLVLWLLPLAIGVAGLSLHYPLPQSSSTPRAPKTQIVNVEIPEPPPPPPELAPPVVTEAPPANSDDIPPAPSIPALPQPIPVALPSPAIAFALPVEGYTKIVDIDQAAHARPAVASTRPSSTGSGHASGTSNSPPAPTAQFANPPITHLTLGEGEGNQPAPDYPRDAVTAQQEGTVTVRFTVDETGGVTKVDVVTPSKWPVLNKAATKTIKDRWHFPPGPPRTYEVPIQFQLNQ